MSIPERVDRGRFTPWTPDEIATLAEMWRDHTHEAIAAEIQRRHGRAITTQAVRCMVRQLRWIKQPHHRWTREMDDMVYDYYGTHTAAEIASRIKARFGANVSVNSVHKRANALGIDREVATGDLTVPDAARLLKMGRTRAFNLVRRLGLKTYGKASARYLPEAEFKKLEAYWAAENPNGLPERVMLLSQAAKRLHFDPQTLRRAIKEGRMRGYLRDRRFWIPVIEVERIEREQREGRTA